MIDTLNSTDGASTRWTADHFARPGAAADHPRNTTGRTLSGLGYRNLALVVCLFAFIVAGRVGAVPPALPPEVRTSPQPPTKAIDEFIRGQIGQLAGSDAARQSAAREQLLAEVSATPQKPSAGFLYAYSRALNDALMPLATNATMRVRLNAAILAARVGDAGRADKVGQFGPLVAVLLNDSNEAVIIWALRAARSAMPAALATPGSKLPAAVGTAAAKWPTQVALAYDAFREVDAKDSKQFAPALKLVQELLDSRIGKYRTGIPVDPSGDAAGTSLLVDTDWWKNQTASQRTTSVQAFDNLISFAGQRVNSHQGSEQEQLKLIVRDAAKAASAASVFESKDALKTKLVPLTQITPRTLPTQVAQLAAQAHGFLAAEFSNLVQPPTLSSGNAATNPSSSTASGSGK